jgi:4-amino-4-deoxy-L-arabinose transferase-like glycosyltransferase
MSYGGDEPQHVDMAYDYAVHPFTFYGPGQLQLSLADVGMQRSLPGYPPTQRLALAPIPPRGHRPSFDQLGGHAFESGGQPNQMVQHPPLYYWMEAVVLRVPGVSGLAWDLQIWLMRLLSVALMTPVPLLCWAAARRLLSGFGVVLVGQASQLAVLAAVVPLTIPNLVRDGSSVDNDTLLILAVSLVLCFLARVLTGDRTSRTAVAISVALAVALWTKGLALVLPPFVLAAYLVEAWRGANAREVIRSVRRPLAIVAVGGLVGSVWWIRNIIDYGTVQINGFGSAFLSSQYGRQDNHGTVTRFLPQFITEFTSRIWGEIGLPDSPSPGPFIIYGWFFVVLLGCVAALVIRGRVGARRSMLVLAATPLAIFCVVAGGSYATFRHWSQGIHASQGRYVYPAIVVIASLAAVGWLHILQPRFRPRLAPIVVAGALVTNAAAWLLLLRSWYQPTHTQSVAGFRAAVHGLLRWSPLPAAVTVILVVGLPVAFGLTCLVGVSRDARSQSAREWPIADDVTVPELESNNS